MPLSVTLSASCSHPGDYLIAQKLKQLLSPAPLAFHWLFSVYCRSWVCCTAPSVAAVWWQEVIISLLVPIVGFSSTGSPCQQHHPTGCSGGIFTAPFDLFPNGRDTKKGLLPPLFHAALDDGSHTGFFPCFTLKSKKFWRPGRWRTSLSFKRRNCSRALKILSAFSCVLKRFILFFLNAVASSPFKTS